MAVTAFNFDSTAEQVAAALSKDITGKNGAFLFVFQLVFAQSKAVLITGTSLNGIGFEAARAVAKFANLVIITGYSSERCVFVIYSDGHCTNF